MGGFVNRWERTVSALLEQEPGYLATLRREMTQRRKLSNDWAAMSGRW